MPRYKLTIEYDGSPFVGWQRQAEGRSVQQAIEEAVLGFTGEAARVGGAGRTDTGVHARGQVAHLSLARAWPADRVLEALNAHLRPEPVAILAVEEVPDGFDARFSAVRRHYLYRIANRRAPLALESGRAWGVPKPLDADAMHGAAQALVGHHDFSTFRAAACQSASPVKTLERIQVHREGELVLIEASARSFLHSQVRSMVGSLKLVGEGRWPEARVAEVLIARDRAACGPLAPPQGLYLMGVDY